MRAQGAKRLLQQEGADVTSLRELAAMVVTAHDRRLHDENGMVAYTLAIERLRSALALSVGNETTRDDVELQAMRHISVVLGSLDSSAARARALLVVALAMVPDAFSEPQYLELVRRAKGA